MVVVVDAVAAAAAVVVFLLLRRHYGHGGRGHAVWRNLRVVIRHFCRLQERCQVMKNTAKKKKI